VIGILLQELELSERNRMEQKAETKELEMGRKYDRNQDCMPVRSSPKSGAGVWILKPFSEDVSELSQNRIVCLKNDLNLDGQTISRRHQSASGDALEIPV
jgi:hypothetical protein